jgi:hypothetical protein
MYHSASEMVKGFFMPNYEYYLPKLKEFSSPTLASYFVWVSYDRPYNFRASLVYYIYIAKHIPKFYDFPTFFILT